MIKASTKKKTPINRGFSSDSYILLDSKLNIFGKIVGHSSFFSDLCTLFTKLYCIMGSFDNRFRRKWQDYGGSHATIAEHSFIEVFQKLFVGTEYKVVSQPTCFKSIYVNVKLPQEELSQIYTPKEAITKHGIQPDGAIVNTRTNKIIFVEIKRQDGWVEGKPRSAGRGNAHERLCKYFTPGLLKTLRKEGGIQAPNLPFWIVFQGDITRDPCRVREIRYWFDDYKANYYFWRNTKDALGLIEHFENNIAPLLE